MNAEFLVLAVRVGKPFICCADIHTTYSMGTVGVTLPILLLLVLLLHYGEGKCCPNFHRWYRRYAADFTAVGAAITLRLGSTLPKFSPLVYL